jgi:hypothetical protein
MCFHFWLRLIFDVKLALQILHLELFFSSLIWFYVCIQVCPSCKFNSANNSLKVFSFMNWCHMSTQVLCLCKACIANIIIERLFPHELIVCVHGDFRFMLYLWYKKLYSFKGHFENENMFSFSKWVLEWAFVSKMWFFFEMCFYFRNEKGFVSVFFLFPKNTIVNKNL